MPAQRRGGGAHRELHRPEQPADFSHAFRRAGRHGGQSAQIGPPPRDPFDRIVWRHGESPASSQSFMLGARCIILRWRLPGFLLPNAIFLAGWRWRRLWRWSGCCWFISRAAPKCAAGGKRGAGLLATRLSHDLRTPLANLKLYAELISRKADGAPELDRYCKVLTEEVDRLDQLAGETIFAARRHARRRRKKRWTLRVRRENPRAL